MDQIEKDIVEEVKKDLQNNLVSLIVEGSYASNDFVEGYSDYDLLALVKKEDVSSLSLENLSRKYHLDIKCDIRLYQDFLNRIKNNDKSKRFINNLRLIKIKNQSRILFGKDVRKIIPNIKEIIKRDLSGELQADYYHATNLNPNWNIFKREPRAWVNYIINMSNNLLLRDGLTVKKEEIPVLLKKNCPEFKGTNILGKAIRLRRTKQALSLNQKERDKLKKDLEIFLEEYKRIVS